MKKLSLVKRSSGSHWVGDGFPVRTVFSYNDIADQMSPFLMLDYAGPTRFEPTTQRRGVGEHPHRGFETVTIVYDGEVEHRDSAGGGGLIGPGDVQWMTAASGLVHEEFHGSEWAKTGGAFEMIQLWVNLPAKDKMAPPAYQAITTAQIPQASIQDLPDGAGTVRVIAGDYNGHAAPTRTFSPMNVWDVSVKAGHRVSFELPAGHTSSVFVLKGQITAGNQSVGEAGLALFERAGTTLAFDAVTDCRLLLLAGEPLNEPIVGYGPFVMNTKAEIQQAFVDFQSGRMGQIAAR
ncbi:MAG: pirin family protein [Leptothrix sp. (in: b-proteobacteria)]